MEPYLIFKGTNTLSLGLYMEEALSKTSPPPRYENVTVPGRDGTLTTWDGTYDVMPVSQDFTVKDMSHVDEICALFTGSGDLISSGEPEKRYMARVKAQGDFSRIIRQWHKFTVQFELQPFAYEADPQKATFATPGILYNIGTHEAFPTIMAYGSGNITVTVNGSSFTVQGVTSCAVIDCDSMEVYEGTTPLVTSGEFPTLSLGKSTISFTGATKIEITPNWRWI